MAHNLPPYRAGDMTYLSVRGALEAHSDGCVLRMEHIAMSQSVVLDRGSFDALCATYEHLTERTPHHHYWIEMPDGSKFPGSYGVEPPTYSFYQAVRDGNEKVQNVNDWVDRWHAANPIETPDLIKYLGFTRGLYAAFLKSEDAIMGISP